METRKGTEPAALTIRQDVMRNGFTMAELVLVVAVIAMLMVLILPSISTMFSAGSFEQAQMVMAATLSSARALAIEKQTYAMVHVHPDPGEGKFWLVTMLFNPNPAPELGYPNGRFVVAAGVRPYRLPGDVGAGEISDTFVQGGNYTVAVNDPDGWRDFITFNVIFGSDGALATDVNGSRPLLDETSPIFSDVAGVGLFPGEMYDGDVVNEDGVRAVALFDFKELNVTVDRTIPLNEAGQFLVINPYTGKFFPTE